MYIDDAVKPLVATLLRAVSIAKTRIYFAHGRNCQAEASFMAAASQCSANGAQSLLIHV